VKAFRSFAVAELLQWFGLLGAALAWTGQLVIGFGVGLAACSAGSTRWGIDVHAWELGLTIAGGLVALLAEAAAVTLYLETRGTDEYDPPPWGRRHFFVVAAMVGNALFFVAILLNGVGTLSHPPCSQS
jgi:hypothetical protein